MKKKKKLLVLVGLSICLFALIGVLLVIKNKNFNDSEEAIDSDSEENTELLLEISEEKTRKISFYLENREKISFIKDEEWALEKNEKFPLEQETVTDIFEVLTALSAERTIEDVEDLSEYGLDTPANVMFIETDEGEQRSISIGNQNEGNGITYVYLDDETDVVYTVAKYLKDLFSYELYDFAEGESYPTVSKSDIRNVEVIKNENSFEIIYDDTAETGWSIEDETYGKKIADDVSCGTLNSMIQALTYSKFYEYDCQDFGTYGLDNPQMEIRVTYIETIEVESDSSEEENEDVTETETVTREFVIYVGNLAEDGNYYVRLNDSTEVHGIEQSDIESLLETSSIQYWTLNMSEIALDDLDYMEVEYGGNSYILKRIMTEKTSDDSLDDSENSSDVSENDDDSEENANNEETVEYITTYYVNDKEVDEDSFETFYQSAIGISCQERKASLDVEGEVELKFDFYGVDGQNVTVSYIPWDGSFYAAVHNDTDFGLVNKMDIKNVIDLFLEIAE